MRTEVHIALDDGDEEKLEEAKTTWKELALSAWSRAATPAASNPRPAKKHRCKALEWLVSTERQLLAMFGKGWLDFAPPAVSPAPPEEEQATITVSVDQGGTGGPPCTS